MPINPGLLSKAELFKACPPHHLLRMAEDAVEVNYQAGDVLYEPWDISESVHIIVKGMVAQYVKYQDGTMLAIDILGPNRVTGTTALFHRDTRLVRAMAIMPATTVVVPSRLLQSLVLSDSALAGVIYEELAHLLRRGVSNLLRAITSEEVSFPTEQTCPANRTTHFLASTNTRTGRVMGMCQRDFSCAGEEGQGCPMAGKPAQVFHEVFVANPGGTR